MPERTNTYREFIIKTNPFLPDIVSGVLWELSIDGLTEEADYLKIYSSGKKEITQLSITSILDKLVAQNIITNYSIEETEIENKNWNEEWEKSLNVIEVTDRIVIKPSFRDYTAKENQIVITIDPKMSFGTGEHQTTKLVLKLLEKNVTPGISMLDVGTGTGILAIAAVKLGAAKALAIDNDEWCYDNSIENCQLNSTSDTVKIQLSEIANINESDFDLVVANIQKNVLLEISVEIKKRIAKNGLLILSGLLTADEKDICDNYKALGFTLLHKEQMDEWIALLFKH